MFKFIRITVLLLILLGVAASAWRSQRTSVQWKYTLPVNLYPINGDESAASEVYIRSLTREDFSPIEAFMQEEAARYGRGAMASKCGAVVGEVLR